MNLENTKTILMTKYYLIITITEKKSVKFAHNRLILNFFLLERGSRGGCYTVIYVHIPCRAISDACVMSTLGPKSEP